MTDAEVLTAPLVIEYPFSRTTGPVIGAFFTALREGFVVGIRGSDGRVVVPPCEYDPVTSESLSEIVEVGDAGQVLTWAWVTEPLNGQPVEHPFAWALIKLDGADTGLLHAIDTGGDAASMSTGMRVKAKWLPSRPAPGETPDAPDSAPDSAASGEPRQFREGHILDIACFVPETEA